MKPAVRASLRWIRRALLDNLIWKVLSLLIAVIIWVMVASEPELASFATVRLEYKNLPDDLEISSEPVSTVSLELRGPAGELTDGSLRPAIVIDMTGVQPGERTFAIGDEQAKLPRGVRMVRAIPSEARFEFERRARRPVPVHPQFSGEGARGYSVAEWRVQPPELGIVGPTSRVARTNAVLTDPVDVSGVVGSAEFQVNAFVNDPFVRFQRSPQVKVTVTMKKN